MLDCLSNKLELCGKDGNFILMPLFPDFSVVITTKFNCMLISVAFVKHWSLRTRASVIPRYP